MPLPDLGVKGEVTVAPLSLWMSERQPTAMLVCLSHPPEFLAYPDSLLLSPTRSKVSVDMSAPLRKEAEPSMLASKLLSPWPIPPEPRGWANPVRSSRLRLTALSVESMMLRGNIIERRTVRGSVISPVIKER